MKLLLRVQLDGKCLVNANSFTYLKSIIIADDGAEKDTKTRESKR